jgi:hypothetical protein
MVLAHSPFIWPPPVLNGSMELPSLRARQSAANPTTIPAWVEPTKQV